VYYPRIPKVERCEVRAVCHVAFAIQRVTQVVQAIYLKRIMRVPIRMICRNFTKLLHEINCRASDFKSWIPNTEIKAMLRSLMIMVNPGSASYPFTGT
jgi:hypothetical protein